MDGVRRQTPHDSVHRRRYMRLANVFLAMVIAWILAGFSMALFVWSLFVAYKWRDSYYQAYGLFKRYSEFVKDGCKYMRITKTLDNNLGTESVNVEILNDADSLSFVLKTFRCNPKDSEDVAFAVREAEELIETIRKA